MSNFLQNTKMALPDNYQSTNERTPLLATLRNSHRRIASSLQIRRIKSKGTVLVILQHYIVCVLFFTIFWLLTEIKIKLNFSVLVTLYGPGALFLLILALSSPLGGWLADVHYGRYKVIQVGLRLMWIGSAFAALWLLMLHTFLKGNQHFTIYRASGGSLSFILIFMGLTMNLANTVQFSVDQIPEASSEELTATVHWLSWASFAGEFTARLVHLIKFCIPIFNGSTELAGAVQFMVPVTMLTLAISFDFLFRGWLTQDPDRHNPLRTIFEVLKFAANHAHPINQRVLVYCTGKPSRMDYAKIKYGGPFTNEQVEDVKTFFRVLVVIVASMIIASLILLQYLSTRYLADNHIDEASKCEASGLHTVYSPSAFAVVIIPLYEFLLHPCLRNKIPSMLVRMSIATSLIVILSAAFLLADSIKHATDAETMCMFTRGPNTYNPGTWFITLSNFLMAVAMVLHTTATPEFIYAQSPYNMRGSITGCLLTMLFITVPVSSGIFIAWSTFRKEGQLGCDFYFLLFQFLVATFGLGFMYAVARWYKWRQRDEDNQQRIIEGLYNRV